MDERARPVPNNQVEPTSPTHQYGDNTARSASDLLRSFERELRKFNSINSQETAIPSLTTSVLHEETTEDLSASVDLSPGWNRKRRRLDLAGIFSWEELLLPLDLPSIRRSYTPRGLLEAVINCYFSQVHPWIPMLHEINLRRQISQEIHRPELEVILHAIIAAALRFVTTDVSVSDDHKIKLAKKAREWVVLNAMNSLSVENLQALTIIAFDDVWLHLLDLPVV